LIEFVQAFAGPSMSTGGGSVGVGGGRVSGQTMLASPPDARFLVAEDDAGGIVGMAKHSLSPGRSGEQPSVVLHAIYVVPDARRKGLGRALLKAVAEIAVETRCGCVAWQVPDSNWDGMTFSTRTGARADRSRTMWRLEGEALAALANG
jgi:GNAT superfamily N-acetyltransferase